MHEIRFNTCIREVLHWKGFSFVDIISDCIELNGRRLGFKTAHQMFKWFDERFHIVEGKRVHLEEDELGIARSEKEELPKIRETVEVKPEVRAEDLSPFTQEELHRFDGTESRPLYIAYAGKIYDVSASPLFQGEKRMRCHVAGKDLTKEMEIAPHGEDLAQILSEREQEGDSIWL